MSTNASNFESVTPKRVKKHQLTLREKIALVEKLHLVALSENGICTYNPGWDDHAVAVAMGGAPYNKDNVRYVRAEIKGVMRVVAPKGLKAKSAEPDNLEKRVLDIERYLSNSDGVYWRERVKS